jgi:hypothetical protein
MPLGGAPPLDPTRFTVGQDLVGLLGPHEWLAAVVPGVDEPADGIDQVADGREAAAMDRLPRDDREEHLDEVQPARRGGREVQLDAPVARQPALHLVVLVRRVVVADGAPRAQKVRLR